MSGHEDRSVSETIDVIAGRAYTEPDIQPNTLYLNGIEGHHIDIHNDRGQKGIVTTTYIEHFGERLEVRTHFDLDDEAAKDIVTILKGRA